MTSLHRGGGSYPSTDPIRHIRNRAAVVITLLLAAAFTACGGDRQATTSTPPARAGSIPEDLKGIWEARIPKDELAVPPDEIPERSSVWTLKFLDTGGDHNGPSVFLSNDRGGDFVGPVSMSGRRIILGTETDCRVLRFEITGPVADATYPTRQQLHLQAEDGSRCPSTVIGSVLTARGWVRGPDAPRPAEEWSLERIRDEGSRGDRTVLESGLTAREYVVCDGLRAQCEGDGPLREPYEHRALEVSQDGRSALFTLADSNFWVTAFDEASVLAMDNPHGARDPFGSRYRLLRIDGTEVPLEMVKDPVPAVPGASVVVVDFADGSADPEVLQHAFLVDEREGTLRPLDLPRNGALPGLLAGRYWGPNTDEFLWFVYVDCRVFWVAGGTLRKRRLDCADDFEFNWTGGDFTYVRGDWFPDGWLKPGRMAVLERTDNRLILHVSLDRGTTWRRIRVSDEAAVRDTLRELG